VLPFSPSTVSSSRLGSFAHPSRGEHPAGPDDDPDRYVGFDVIFADDGRIRSVYGFMDVVPAT
jgi:hypothetical protein